MSDLHELPKKWRQESQYVQANYKGCYTNGCATQLKYCADELEAALANQWRPYPETKPSKDSQIEVVFYCRPYEWLTGLFTPKGFCNNPEDIFQWHDHQGSDKYFAVYDVTHWMPLPKPPTDTNQ